MCAPFDDALWIALFVTCLLVSLLMPSTLRDGSTQRPLAGGGASGLGARPKYRVTMFYHAWSMVVGGDDLEWTSNVSSQVPPGHRTALVPCWMCGWVGAVPGGALDTGGPESGLTL